jgi:acetyl-CoA C-acetyltransferase
MKRKVAVVGAGMIKFGELFERDLDDMVEEAYLNALESVDKGIKPEEIEAAWLGNAGGGVRGTSGVSLAFPTGLFRIPISRNENGCATGSDAFRNACLGVASGIYKVALVVGAEKMRDEPGGLIRRIATRIDIWDARGRTMPAFFGLRATRHFHEFGSKREHLAMVSVKNHRNGAMYPYAHFQWETTVEKVLSSPMVSYPLTLLDCCPVTDGAAAVIVASSDVAKKYTDTPVYVAGSGLSCDSWQMATDEHLVGFPATKQAAEQAYRMAGIQPKDIQVAEVHDCFTITEILDYEDLRFCKKGEGHLRLEEGMFDLKGELPVNPSGGLIAKGHPIGATGVAQICELFEQLRGTAGKIQVKDAEIGLQHNIGLGRGATGSQACVHILSR